MVTVSFNATRTPANNKAMYIILVKTFHFLNVWPKRSHNSPNGLEWEYPLYTQTHKFVKKTGE